MSEVKYLTIYERGKSSIDGHPGSSDGEIVPSGDEVGKEFRNCIEVFSISIDGQLYPLRLLQFTIAIQRVVDFFDVFSLGALGEGNASTTLGIHNDAGHLPSLLSIVSLYSKSFQT